MDSAIKVIGGFLGIIVSTYVLFSAWKAAGAKKLERQIQQQRREQVTDDTPARLDGLDRLCDTFDGRIVRLETWREDHERVHDRM